MVPRAQYSFDEPTKPTNPTHPAWFHAYFLRILYIFPGPPAGIRVFRFQDLSVFFLTAYREAAISGQIFVWALKKAFIPTPLLVAGPLMKLNPKNDFFAASLRNWTI